MDLLSRGGLVIALLSSGCVWIGEDHHQESLDGDGDGVSVFEECDDQDPKRTEGPGVWFADADGDGFGAGEALNGCWVEGLVAVDGDCDDLDPLVHPDGVERCDPLDVDEDCDGAADDDDPEGADGLRSWYLDGDGDGFGGGADELRCDPLPGEVDVTGDCDDTSAQVAPDQPERCGPVDDDCDGMVDEPGTIGTLVWFADEDEDGYGDPFAFVEACEAPEGAVDNGDDCDDGSWWVSPGRPEVCDLAGIDEDCDGLANGDDSGPFHADADEDGYGDPDVSSSTCVVGWVEDSSDCDDMDPELYPGSGC